MGRIPDEELIRKLQFSERRELDGVFSYLYRKVYDQVYRFVRKYKGIEADVEDIFQDGLIALLKLARRGQLAADVNVEAYLFSICRNLWFKQLQKKKVNINPDDLQMAAPAEEVPLYSMMKSEEQQEILNALQQLGEDCRKVLVYFYYDRMRMRKIADLMGYASEQVAKNRKSECMKKLKHIFNKTPNRN
ncbi:MAG: sigma-70 family RNA polymerase sigma factor [Bacteroidota bacterium]